MKILSLGDVTVKDDGENFSFYVKGVSTNHSISSDPAITSQERLLAHSEGVATLHEVSLGSCEWVIVDDFAASDLNCVASSSRNEAMRKDIKFDGFWQINGIDKNNQRTIIGTTFSKRLSKKLINQLFMEDGDAVKLDFYCEAYWLDESLPLIERWEERQPTGEGAAFSILRKAK